MSETTINQRLNFLLDALGMKAGPFSRALGLSETTVRNYIDRNSKPSSDVLEKITSTFKQVNLVWLVTGEGEHFLPGTESSTVIHQTQKKTKGSTVIGTNHGDVITNIEECRKELTSTTAKLSLAQQEVTLLREQLKMQESLIAAKEETISLLRATFNRPN